MRSVFHLNVVIDRFKCYSENNVIKKGKTAQQTVLCCSVDVWLYYLHIRIFPHFCQKKLAANSAIGVNLRSTNKTSKSFEKC